MSIEIKVPDIGADPVEVTEILVKVGDTVEQDQSLLTVEGDKASMEVPSPEAGTIESISVKVGDSVSTGSLIMVFGSTKTSSNSQEESKHSVEEPSKKDASTGQASKEKTISVPDIGNDEVEVTEILVTVGDKVEAEDPLITVEGDKASMEVPAPFSGIVKTIDIQPGAKVKTGSPIMSFTVIEAETESEAASIGAPADEQQENTPVVSEEKPASKDTQERSTDSEFSENLAYVHASPVIRRLAREFGINLSKIKGMGRKDRILKEDVQAYVKDAMKRAEASTTGNAGISGLLPWPKIDFSKFGETEVVELGRIQKLSGANLHRNWVMIPHVTQHDETDITELEDFRKRQNIDAEKQKLDYKITPLVFIMKAVAKALEKFPRFNSSLSEDTQRLTLKKYVNIGVAVDTPNGLVVPVFRDVNKKGIIELSRELAEISKKARAGKLTGADMQGGCFTISSLGGIGGTAFTPIVNAPEVAILGVSKSSVKPIWNGKEFAPRLMLPLALSYDHRVIDGADGARFISFVNSVMSDIRHLVM